MIEKYTFDASFFKRQKKIILVKQDSESREHVVLKLLAYMLFYDPNLLVEYKIDHHYKPDLVLLDEDNRPKLWIDCGQVSVEKASKLAKKLKQTRVVIVKKSYSEMINFKRVMEKKSEHHNRLEYLAFEKPFIRDVATAIEKSNRLALYEAAENVIGLAMHDEVFESDVFREAKL